MVLGELIDDVVSERLLSIASKFASVARFRSNISRLVLVGVNDGLHCVNVLP